MTLEGTVVNGVIVLDAGANLPEGTRVRVEPAEDDIDIDDSLFPPPEPYDREKELAILRESIEDAKAGRGMEAREFLKKLAQDLNLPLEPGEE